MTPGLVRPRATREEECLGPKASCLGVLRPVGAPRRPGSLPAQRASGGTRRGARETSPQPRPSLRPHARRYGQEEPLFPRSQAQRAGGPSTEASELTHFAGPSLGSSCGRRHPRGAHDLFSARRAPHAVADGPSTSVGRASASCALLRWRRSQSSSERTVASKQAWELTHFAGRRAFDLGRACSSPRTDASGIGSREEREHDTRSVPCPALTSLQIPAVARQGCLRTLPRTGRPALPSPAVSRAPRRGKRCPPLRGLEPFPAQARASRTAPAASAWPRPAGRPPSGAPRE